MANDNDPVSAIFDQAMQQSDPDEYAKSVHDLENSKQNAAEQSDKQAHDAVGDIFDQSIQQSKESDDSNQQAAQNQEKWSKLESGGQGVLQGATAGFSDELGGVEGAIMEKLAGNPDNKKMMDLYREYRDLQRRRNEAAQEQNPGSYLAGNIAGGVVSAAALPGMNTLKGATALGAATGLGTSGADLTSGNTSELARAGVDTAVGGGLGLLGGKVAQGIANKLSPGALQQAGSEMIASTAGMEPEEQAATAWVRNGDRWMKEPVEGGKGTGQIAVEQGAAPTMGGNPARIKATQQAIDNNYNKLDPLLDTAQENLDPKLDDTLNSVGHVGDKLANFYNQFVDNMGQTDQAQKIGIKLLRDNRGNIEKLSQLDGNLQALNAFKRDLQSQADRAGAYGPNQNKDAANFLKGMAGVVRQHIEDLANASDPASQLGSQIKEANNNINNLINFKDSMQDMSNQPQEPSVVDMAKSMLGPGIKAAIGYKLGGPIGAVALPMAGMAANAAMGQTMGTTAKILGGKAMLSGAKAVSTPIGNIIMRTAPPIASKIISNPFSQEILQSQGQKLKPSDSTQIASTIYNADDTSLKKINNSFKQDPSLDNITSAFDRYFETKDPQDLNSATFLLLQNKNAIKLLTGGQ